MEEAARVVSDDYLISSTNWIVAQGSLRDAISFETSTTPADEDGGGGGSPTPTGLLLSPPSEDSPPCEITISLRDKHEIHRVYVRSTARVYEIYYACDQQNSDREYLCTVRCGAAAKEITPPSFKEGATDFQGVNKGNAVLPEQMVKSECNNSDEDGWIEVKVPDSPLQDDSTNFLSKRSVGNASPTMQVHYEATAEISDASPFVSLTLRLLSLQTKAYVHVEEIYIYADPIESTILEPSENVGENLGGNSLLVSLGLGLLQLSRSGATRVKDRCSSDESDTPEDHYGWKKAAKDRRSSDDYGWEKAAKDRCSSEMPKDHYGWKKAAQMVNTGIGRTVAREGYFSMADEKVGPMQEPSKAKPEITQLGASQKLTDEDKIPKSIIDENNLAYSRVEKVLGELVSRVGRIEAFCTRFEENMMKPLGCIEMRLQQLEQKLDGFTVRTKCSEQIPSLRISAPEFSFDESDLEKKDSNTSYKAAREDNTYLDVTSSADEVVDSPPESQKCPGLTIRAPEFPYEDDSDNKDCNSSYTAQREDASSHDISSSADEVIASVPESQMCPGLKVKAPDFPNEDDECTNTSNALDSLVKEDRLKGNKSISIDGALASALAAFVNSSTIKSVKRSPSLMDIPQRSLYGNKNGLDSSTVVPSEGPSNELNKSVVEDNTSELLDAARKGTSFGDVPLLPDDITAPDNKFNEFDMRNKPRDISAIVKEGTALDDSLADEAVAASAFASQMGADLVVTSTEFLNEDGSHNCDDEVESQVGVVHKDQPSTPADIRSASSLAAFLSPARVQSPRSRPILNHVPPDLSNLATSTVSVAREGAEESGNKNHGNDMESKLDFEPFLNILPPNISSEQEGCNNNNNNTGLDCSTLERGTSNSIIHEDSLTQKNHDGEKWNEGHSTDITEEGFLTQKQLHSMGVGLNGSISQKCHGGWTDESDTEEAAVHGVPGLNQLGRGWAEDSSSTCSSFDENFIKNKVQIEWSDGGSSTDSFRGAFTINECNWQTAAAATSNYGRSEAFAVDSTISQIDFTTDAYQSDADHIKEKKDTDLEQALHSTLDSEDVIYSVKFAPDKNWVSGLPLEVLLGDMPDTKVQDSDIKVDYEDGIASARQHNSSVGEVVDQNAKSIVELLSVVEDLTMPTDEASNLGESVLLSVPAVSNNPQVQNCATEGNSSDGIMIGQQHNPSLPEANGIDHQKPSPVDPHLLGLECPAPTEEAFALGDGVLQEAPACSINPQLLPSLI